MVIHNHHQFHDELLTFEIFRRLPIDTLLCCNCVSKLWNSIISNPFFASFHLENSPFSTHQSLLINTKTSFLSYNLEDHEIYRVSEIPCTDSSSIVASFHGLICLNDDANNSVYIWNPITSKKIQIPYPQILNKTEVIWGFGYASSTKDYKLIRIIVHDYLNGNVQIFSFNNNSWKNLEIGEISKFGEIPPLSETGVTINDMIYWGVYYTLYDVGYYDKIFHIMGFNLITEEFTPLESIPDWPDHGFDDPPALFEKDGCLCVGWKNGGSIDIEMYKVEEGSGKSSWKKLFHIDQDKILGHKIQGITKAGNCVVYLDSENISVIDPNQDPPKEVSSLRIPDSKNVISYVKSLLSPLDLVGGSA